MKTRQVMMKKAKGSRFKKIIIFWIFATKKGYKSKNVRNKEEGSNDDEKGQNRWKIKKINNFRILFQKTMEKFKNGGNS
jgi:hypothetical protein